MGYRGNPSPFMKMSFETTLGFLKDAVQEADFDALTGPSARIVTGRLGVMGTGAFDVYLPLAQHKTNDDTYMSDVETGDARTTNGIDNSSTDGSNMGEDNVDDGDVTMTV
jgi:DNA-directed RNA polymerase I subunit RPA1